MARVASGSAKADKQKRAEKNQMQTKKTLRNF